MDERHLHHRLVVDREPVVARTDGSRLLEVPDGVFDYVALAVELLVEVGATPGVGAGLVGTAGQHGSQVVGARPATDRSL